jgi:oligopeptide transport system substrate-binding protein
MRLFWPLFVALLSLNSCENIDSKQFEFAGGTLRMAIDNDLSTYNSMEISDYFSATVVSQMMEGLVSLDPKTLRIVPQIAKSWKISDDGLTYSFSIRQNILFHYHPLFFSEEERRLKVSDIKYTFERICSKNRDGSIPHAYNFLFKDLVVGAAEHLEGKVNSVIGFQTNGSNFIIKLLKKDENFLNKLTNICASICSQKVLENGNKDLVIGTGPFYLESIKSESQKSIMLAKNEDYYLKDKNGNALPYLDKLEFFIQNRKLDQLDLFEQHQLDLILGLPTRSIAKMLEGKIEDFNSKPPLLVLYDNPLLATQYYFFNMRDPRFKDPRVRQAFNYAIDRDKIGIEVLRNQYNELGNFGVVPPIYSIFKGYDFEKIKEVCYTYDPVKAKKLLADAGYPNGQGFGSVILRLNIDDKHSEVADEFAQQIFQNLNINVNIDASTFEQKEEDASNGNGQIFRTAWYGDYANPESFLVNFYGKMIPSDSRVPSYINQSCYHNPLFDYFFEAAKNSNRKPEAMENYAKAERILMQDPPVIPLWYMGDIQIVYSNVRNLHFNALNMFIFKEVYKKEWTEEEYTKATN